MDAIDNVWLPQGTDAALTDVMRRLAIGDELLWTPERLVPFEHWVGHIPFAFWLVKVLRPRLLVELGTHRGNSYCAFCQAVSMLKLNSRALAVDTWRGDLHMGREEGLLADLHRHHDPRYDAFSTLLEMTFDTARAHVEPGTVDLLHFDGTHTYDDVRHDFETWRDSLSSRGVVFSMTSVYIAKSSVFGVSGPSCLRSIPPSHFLTATAWACSAWVLICRHRFRNFSRSTRTRPPQRERGRYSRRGGRD